MALPEAVAPTEISGFPVVRKNFPRRFFEMLAEGWQVCIWCRPLISLHQVNFSVMQCGQADVLDCITSSGTDPGIISQASGMRYLLQKFLYGTFVASRYCTGGFTFQTKPRFCTDF